MKITLAYPYTDDKGKTHKPDSTVDLPEAIAKGLLFQGRARQEDTTPTDSGRTRAPAKKAGSSATSKEK